MLILCLLVRKFVVSSTNRIAPPTSFILENFSYYTQAFESSCKLVLLIPLQFLMGGRDDPGSGSWWKILDPLCYFFHLIPCFWSYILTFTMRELHYFLLGESESSLWVIIGVPLPPYFHHIYHHRESCIIMILSHPIKIIQHLHGSTGCLCLGRIKLCPYYIFLFDKLCVCFTPVYLYLNVGRISIECKWYHIW